MVVVARKKLELAKRERFDGLSEAEICEWIVDERLTYKDVVGRLPKEIGLTPAIMVACLPTLSDRDLRILTPTLGSTYVGQAFPLHYDASYNLNWAEWIGWLAFRRVPLQAEKVILWVRQDVQQLQTASPAH